MLELGEGENQKEVWTKVKTHHILLKENDEFLILN